MKIKHNCTYLLIFAIGYVQSLDFIIIRSNILCIIGIHMCFPYRFTKGVICAFRITSKIYLYTLIYIYLIPLFYLSAPWLAYWASFLDGTQGDKHPKNGFRGWMAFKGQYIEVVCMSYRLHKARWCIQRSETRDKVLVYCAHIVQFHQIVTTRGLQIGPMRKRALHFLSIISSFYLIFVS